MVNSLKGSIMLIFRLKKKDFHLFLVSHGIFPSAFTHTHTHTHTHTYSCMHTLQVLGKECQSKITADWIFGHRSKIQGASQVVLLVKNRPANAGDMKDAGSTSGQGRSPGGGHGNPLKYSCLENPVEEEPSGLWSKGS